MTKVVIPTSDKETEVDCKVSSWPSQISERMKHWSNNHLLMIVSRENCSKASISFDMLWSSYQACSNTLTQLRFVQHKLSSVWNCGSVESGKILKHRNSLYASNPTMGFGLHGTTQLKFLASVHIDIKANLPWWGVVCFNEAKSVKILKASSEEKWSRDSFLESHL